jgi:PAS domain S-box-containing protein
MARLNQHTRLILESAGEGIFGVGLDGNITFANAALCAMLGWQEEEMLGHNVQMFWHHSSPDKKVYPVEACQIYETFRSGQRQHRERQVFWRKDGRPVPVEYTASPIIEQNETVGAVVVCRDISERKQMEARLLQTSKMEALGKLAGGVAHDFNNLLTVINGYTDVMLEKAGPSGKGRTQLAIIKQAGERAANLTRQLLLFSHQQVVQPQVD